MTGIRHVLYFKPFGLTRLRLCFSSACSFVALAFPGQIWKERHYRFGSKGPVG